MKNIFCYLFCLLMSSYVLALENAPTIIQVAENDLVVNGKPSKVFTVRQPNGFFGLTGKEGQLFNVVVENKTRVPLVLHWHGILSPNPDDGVPYVTQLPIPPGGSYAYKFKLQQSGTYWFHSHYKLQEQKLMAAPLIIYGANEKQEQDALMFVQDFTFQDPRAVYANLRKNLQKTNGKMNMSHDAMKMDHQAKTKTSAAANKMAMPMDLTDVKFDAYLTNHKTLQAPDIVPVKANETVRLRVINASASSNYYLDLGKLTGVLIAVDGEAIKPINGSIFQMAIGNRLDIRIRIPAGEGAYPILAKPEGTKAQTGLILATAKATIPKLPQITNNMTPALNDNQEYQLTAEKSFAAHKIDRSLTFDLQGDMSTYNWTINGQNWPAVTPFKIKSGERVEMVFKNHSGMSHPMHFHGHVFQITELNGKKYVGRKGDTVNVLPNESVKVIFDANNPGIWMLHCHILYHQMGGMMTTVNYEGYPDRFTLKQRMEGEKLYGSALGN